MSKKHTPSQVKAILHTVENGIAAGDTIAQVCAELGISAATYHLWRKNYSHMTLAQPEHLQALQQRYARLEKEVRAPSLDNAILKEGLRVARPLTPEQKCEIVRHICAKLKVSERQARAALSQPRCTQRYKSQQQS